jgi:hypothetical protein
MILICDMLDQNLEVLLIHSLKPFQISPMLNSASDPREGR